MKGLNVVFVSVGGHGTVLPLLTIGKGLSLRGHSVCLIAHSVYQQMTESDNIRFETISDGAFYQKCLDNKPLTFGRYSYLFGINCSSVWNARIFEILKGTCSSRAI